MMNYKEKRRVRGLVKDWREEKEEREEEELGEKLPDWAQRTSEHELWAATAGKAKVILTQNEPSHVK